MRSLWTKTVGELWAVSTPARGSLGFSISVYETKADANRAARFEGGKVLSVPLLITSIDGEDYRFAERAEHHSTDSEDE